MNLRALPLIAALLLCGFSSEQTLPDPAQEARAQSLFREIRCVVCEGQSVAESNVALAADMRGLIRAFIREGKSDAQVKEYLVARYGEEILFSPPVTSGTALLWAAPFMLLLFGLARFAIRRR